MSAPSTFGTSLRGLGFVLQMDGFTASNVSSHHEKKKRRRLFRLSEWRDWPGLPKHLLFDIVDKFTAIDDHIQFGRVCVSWQSVFLQNMKNIGSPFLLVAPPPGDKDYYKRRALYSLSTKRVYNLRMQLPHNKSCCGSSFGWLVTVEEKGINEYHVQLQNVFLNRIIDLPPLDNIVQPQVDLYGGLIDSLYLCKAVLSSDPLLSNDFIVMGIISQYKGLAFFKSGNSIWSLIGEHWMLDCKPWQLFSDVIYFHKAKQFYALLTTGAVLAIGFLGAEGEPKLTQIAPPLRRGFAELFLVEDSSSGDLFQVHKIESDTKRGQNGKLYLFERFVVFKFDAVKQNWTEIRSLRGKVMFLGSNCLILRSALDCPGCLPNCIYYTDDRRWAKSYDSFCKPPFDGIYNLEDGTIQPHYLVLTCDKPLPSPIWLEPTLTLANMRALNGL